MNMVFSVEKNKVFIYVKLANFVWYILTKILSLSDRSSKARVILLIVLTGGRGT